MQFTTAVTIAALVASAMARSSIPSGFQAEVRATTATTATTTCDGSLGCIAGTQYCASRNGTLINLHVPCAKGRNGKRDATPEDLLKARAGCAYKPTCINYTEYCMGGSRFANLHTPCLPKREAELEARTDCAGSIGCIMGTQYCSYKGHLTSLHVPCGDDWE